MRTRNVMVAIQEARRFIERAEAALLHNADHLPPSTGTPAYLYASKHSGACRRASLDLTRALADMRRATR